MQDRLREAHEAVAYEAMHDPLTGVLNRRALSDVLARAVSAEGRHHGGPALGICDIDGFKAINDRQGDQAGDDALRGLVRVMTGTLRASDVLSRFGGDEFVVLAERIGTAAVETTFERVRAAVAASPISTGAGDVAITITFGVALWRDDDTEDRLFARADAALYRAKSEGRDRVCIAGETQP
jgi:diguanylate cyclase (GGDEF)-like protein